MDQVKAYSWAEFKGMLESGRHFYSPEVLERSPLDLKKYAAKARDYRHKNPLRTREGRTLDNTSTAIQYALPVGAPGTVTRLHPDSIWPTLIDGTSPPLYYGQPVVIDATTQGVRPLAAGDLTASAFDPYGITVRPFPLQQSTGFPTTSNNSATPPAFGIIDVLTAGGILIQFNVSGSAPVKGAQAYAWAAATSGAHTQGLFETAAGTPGTNTVLIGSIPRTIYQGGWDANNVGELQFHI
jgi:hypothetical protein